MLNQGPHGLYDRGRFRQVLAELGVPVTGAPPDVAHGWVWSHGAAHRIPTGLWSLLRTSAVGAGAKVALARLLATLPSVDPAPLSDLSFEQWLDRVRLAAGARPLVRMLARIATYSAAPDRISADAAVAQLQLALRGVTYVDGGWQRLVDGLVAAADRAGVRRRPDLGAATRLRRQDGGWVVATMAGTVRAAAVVLAAGSPSSAAALLGRDPGWTSSAGPTVHASCLDLGLRRPAPRGILFGVEEPLYLATHAGGGAGAAGPAPGARDAEPPARRGARSGRHPRRAVGPRPEGRDHRRRRARRAVPAPHAGDPRAARARAGRRGRTAPVAVPGEPGLFVAGDWVGDRGLLADAAAASATRASELAAAAARGVPARPAVPA
ncbi:MAG: hypothetical protein R2726_19500 [Acidimicrobiales bacterium]